MRAQRSCKSRRVGFAEFTTGGRLAQDDKRVQDAILRRLHCIIIIYVFIIIIIILVYMIIITIIVIRSAR